MAEKKKIKKKFSEHDPEKYINVEPTIREAKNSTAVISFGRMNPITVGHEKLVSRVIAEALRRKATPMVFMSHSQDAKKNPLSYEDKLKFARRAFGKVVIDSDARTIIEIAKNLSQRFNNLVMVVGQDRVREFTALLNTYNGRDYSFENIEVVSAGARDPDSESVEGMSASKMRSFAQEGDFENFKKGLPKKLKSSAKEVYDTVRSNMNLSEEYLDEAPLSVTQRRKRGLIMKRYKTKIAAARRRARRRKASPEKLKLRAQRRALSIIRDRLMRNKQYSEMSPTEKIALDRRLERVPKTVISRIARRELPKVRRAEAERLAAATGSKVKKEDLNLAFENFFLEAEDPDVGHMKGSQPKGYYKGVKKSVKDDRARHFAKHAKMDDNNPAAYKPAPGDKEAKTKTSKHTKKFKQMFGEASCADMRVRSRPHMALEKNGSVKFDKRFRMFKKNMNEEYEDLTEDLSNLILDMDSFIMSEEFDSLMEANPTEALKKKAEKTGMPYGILKKVYDRGVAAWRTGHRPGTTPSQWGLARVNSFATKSSGTWGKADKDLAAKVNEAVSPTAVKPFVQTKDPNKAAKVSDTTKHKLGIGLSMKHMLQHGIRAVDRDNDGDVDAFEKSTPDEITGAEKKNLTKVMQKKLAGEVKHTRIGHAFESAEDVNENAATNMVKASIKAEKERDARKHDRMLDRAKMKDLKTKLTQEGSKDPSDREWGTDSLTKTYKKDTPGENLKEESPLMKDIPRGSRVRFVYKTMVGDNQNLEGTVVGAAQDDEGTSVKQRVRIRDDNGKLYVIKHSDVELIEATMTRGFEGKMIKIKNVPVRMVDGTIKRLPPGKSSSSDGGNGNGNGD